MLKKRYTVALATDKLRRIVAACGGRYKIRPNVSNVVGADGLDHYGTMHPHFSIRETCRPHTLR